MKLFDITLIGTTKNQYIIEKIEPEKVKNGIILTNTATEIEKGIVVKCATPVPTDSELKIGDVVFFQNHVGNEITWNKKSYLIIKEEDILGTEI